MIKAIFDVPRDEILFTPEEVELTLLTDANCHDRYYVLYHSDKREIQIIWDAKEMWNLMSQNFVLYRLTDSLERAWELVSEIAQWKGW